MANRDNEKLKRFSEALLADAQRRADSMLAKSKQSADELVSSAKADADERLRMYFDSESIRLKNELDSACGACRREWRNKISELRESMTQKLMLDLAFKMQDYTHTSEYRDYLCRVCERVLSAHKINFTVYLSGDDMQYSLDILKALSKSPEAAAALDGIECDSQIKLGGVRFVSGEKGIALDLTFDRALEDQREKYTALIGAEMSKFENSGDNND
jgi:vacuolar-type H+-ATPase subunit E/Vma4